MTPIRRLFCAACFRAAAAFSVAVAVMIVALGGAALAPDRAAAQDASPFSVAIRVNDAVISGYDIDQRMRLINFAEQGRAQNARQRAIRELTQEALKMQEAERLGFRVDDEALARAVGQLSANNRMPNADALYDRLRTAGVDREGFDRQIRATLAWNQVLARRFGDRMQPTEAEIDEAFRAAQQSGPVLYDVRHLLLPLAPTAPIPLAKPVFERATALRAQMKSCAALMKLAPKYPPSGSIGILPAEQMPAPVREKVVKLQVGQTTEPMRSQQGVHVFMLCGKQRGGGGSREQVSAMLAQQRADQLSEGYLADLEARAIIESNL